MNDIREVVIRRRFWKVLRIFEGLGGMNEVSEFRFACLTHETLLEGLCADRTLPQYTNPRRHMSAAPARDPGSRPPPQYQCVRHLGEVCWTRSMRSCLEPRCHIGSQPHASTNLQRTLTTITVSVRIVVMVTLSSTSTHVSMGV